MVYPNQRREAGILSVSPEVPVTPEVLTWARETSGWTVEQVAKKLKVAPKVVRGWESGTSPRLTQLRLLAEVFRRPLAILLLPAPPPADPLPPDFRVLPAASGNLSPKTRLAIRRATRLRSVARDLGRELGREWKSNPDLARITESPEVIAHRERDRLVVNTEQQLDWPTAQVALQAWRSAVEATGILVFQFPMPVEDARGFSLSDSKPFAITINASDAVHARVFTLFHEYGHLLLRQPGICLPGEDRAARDARSRVEMWCDRFSGALLAPRSALDVVIKQFGIQPTADRLTEFLELTSRQLKVSKQVILRRLRYLRLIHPDVYRPALADLLLQDRGAKRGGRAVPPGKKCLRQNGRLFTSLVLEARERNLIPYADVSDYLSLPLRYLDDVRSALATLAA